MDELIELIMERTNISREKAEKVVETVLGFLEDKLPEPLGGSLRNFIGNEQSVDKVDDTVDAISKGLGDWLSKRANQ